MSTVTTTTNTDNNQDYTLLKYKVEQLETAVKDISSIKDIVTRWDVRFEGIKLTEIPVLSQQVEENKKKIEEMERDNEKDFKKLYRYAYLIIGGSLVINAIVIFLHLGK